MKMDSNYKSGTGFRTQVRMLEVVLALIGIGTGSLISAGSIFGRTIGVERTTYFDGRPPITHALTYFDSKPIQAATLIVFMLVIGSWAFVSLRWDLGGSGARGLVSMCVVTIIAAIYLGVVSEATGLSWILASIPVLLLGLAALVGAARRLWIHG